MRKKIRQIFFLNYAPPQENLLWTPMSADCYSQHQILTDNGVCYSWLAYHRILIYYYYYYYILCELFLRIDKPIQAYEDRFIGSRPA